MWFCKFSITVSVSVAAINGSCIVTDNDTTCVFLSTLVEIRSWSDLTTSFSSLVSRNGSVGPSSSGSSARNNPANHPNALKGAASTAPHHGPRNSSET